MTEEKKPSDAARAFLLMMFPAHWPHFDACALAIDAHGEACARRVLAAQEDAKSDGAKCEPQQCHKYQSELIEEVARLENGQSIAASEYKSLSDDRDRLKTELAELGELHDKSRSLWVGQVEELTAQRDAWVAERGRLEGELTSWRQSSLAYGDRFNAEQTAHEATKAELAEARDCGQEVVCKITPGCHRHWQERNRELRDELKQPPSAYSVEERARDVETVRNYISGCASHAAADAALDRLAAAPQEEPSIGSSLDVERMARTGEVEPAAVAERPFLRPAVVIAPPLPGPPELVAYVRHEDGTRTPITPKQWAHAVLDTLRPDPAAVAEMPIVDWLERRMKPSTNPPDPAPLPRPVPAGSELVVGARYRITSISGHSPGDERHYSLGDELDCLPNEGGCLQPRWLSRYPGGSDGNAWAAWGPPGEGCTYVTGLELVSMPDGES